MELERRATAVRDRLPALIESALVGFIVLVVLLLFSPINTPFLARDEGVFVYIGQAILEGKLPYRDVWDHKGPLIYYINALGLWLGHNSLWGIWLVESVLLAASLILLYRLLRATISREAAFFGLLLWLTGFAVVVGGNIVEEYAILLGVLSLIVAMRPGSLGALWLGALAGLAFLLRPNEVAAPAAALLFVLGDQVRHQGWRSAGGSLAQFVAGFSLLTGSVAAYFAYRQALPDLLDGMLLFNLLYVSNGGDVWSGLLAGAGYLAVPLLFSVVGVLAVLFLAKRPLSREQKRLLFLSGLLLIVAVPLSLLSGRGYRHYYIAWLLPLSLLGSYSLLWFRGARAASALRKGVWMLAWIVLLLGALIAVRIRIVPLLSRGAAVAETQAIEAIRALKPADGELLIWGDETSYAVMAGRRLAGRYLYFSPIMQPGMDKRMAPGLLCEISSRHPLIIDAWGDGNATWSLNGAAPSPYLEELYMYIHQHYRVVGTVSGKNWPIWASGSNAVPRCP